MIQWLDDNWLLCILIAVAVLLLMPSFQNGWSGAQRLWQGVRSATMSNPHAPPSAGGNHATPQATHGHPPATAVANTAHVSFGSVAIMGLLALVPLLLWWTRESIFAPSNLRYMGWYGPLTFAYASTWIEDRMFVLFLIFTYIAICGWIGDQLLHTKKLFSASIVLPSIGLAVLLIGTLSTTIESTRAVQSARVPNMQNCQAISDDWQPCTFDKNDQVVYFGNTLGENHLCVDPEPTATTYVIQTPDQNGEWATIFGESHVPTGKYLGRYAIRLVTSSSVPFTVWYRYVPIEKWAATRSCGTHP